MTSLPFVFPPYESLFILSSIQIQLHVLFLFLLS